MERRSTANLIVSNFLKHYNAVCGLLVPWFINSSVRSSVCLFAHLLVRPSVRSLRPFIISFVRPLVRRSLLSFVRPFVLLLGCSKFSACGEERKCGRKGTRRAREREGLGGRLPNYWPNACLLGNSNSVINELYIKLITNLGSKHKEFVRES